MAQHSKSQSKKKPAPPQPPQGSQQEFIWENLKIVLIALTMAIVIKTSLVEAYKIPSASMEDTLLVGDFLLANKFIYGARLPVVGWQLPAVRDPESGDVFIFRYPRDPSVNYIKRCVAGPGQTVQVIDKVLYIDGKVFKDPEHAKFTQPFVKPNLHPAPNGADWGQPDNFGPYKVPAGQYFAMGDNRDNSYDSRFWGTVPRENVLGRAMLIHWSWRPDDNSPDIALDDPLSVPQLVIYNTIHFVQRVRWGRLFSVIR